MTTEIVPATPAGVQTAAVFNLIVQQADVLAKSRIIPRAYQGKPYDVIAAGLAGHSYGWDVMTSLRNYHVIEGTASLRPEAMLGLVRRHGHSVTLNIVTDANGEKSAIATGRRADNNDTFDARFSTADAKAAGLLGKKNWSQYLDAMLTWRAVSALCRYLFSDVVLGAGYVPEELGADVSATGEILEADPFTDTFTTAEAKRMVLDRCGNSVALAKEVWGERGNDQVTSEELDVLLSLADARMSDHDDTVDAEVVMPLVESQDVEIIEEMPPKAPRAKLGSMIAEGME